MKRKGTPRKNGGRGSRLAGRGWRIGVTCIAVLAAFCTVYALVLPATALEGETYCGYTEHVHSDACYETVLVCGQEESAEHTHSDACYEQVLVCGLPEHVHSDACYVNPDAETVTASETVEETAGTEAASDGSEAAQSETTAPETVTEGESALTEGLTESESSGTEGLTETETETAQESETETETEETETETETETEEEEPVTLVYDSPEYIVTVTYGAEAQLPENTVLTVKEYDKDSETYKARYAETAALYGWPEETDSSLLEGLPEGKDVADLVRLFDIAFVADGVEVEPAVPVSVSVVYRDEEIRAGEPDDIKVLQFPEYGPEKLEAAVTAETGEETIRFNGDQFTDFMLFDGRMDGVTVKTEEPTVLIYDGPDYVVTVTYGPEAQLPENTVLTVSEYDKSSETYQSRYAEAAELYGWTEETESDQTDAATEETETEQTDSLTEEVDVTDYIRLFDISFTVDGEKVEPAASVSVSIAYRSETGESSEANDINVLHFAESGAEELAAEVTADSGEETVRFDVSSFSDFMLFDARVSAMIEDTPSLLADGDLDIVETYTVVAGGTITITGSDNSSHGQNQRTSHSWVIYDGDSGSVELRNNTSATVTIVGLSEGTVMLEHKITTSNNSGGGGYGPSGSSSMRTTTEYYTVNVISSDTPIKVYVYVAATGLSDECLNLLGIDSNTLDSNGYFPAGEICLDASYFTDKGFNTAEGAALINNANDWQALLAALGKMDTSTLVNQTNWNYSGAVSSGKKDYSLNKGNHVGDYLEQAEAAYNQGWGSQKTALFHWHSDSSVAGCASYGFEDQTVQYHLDLFFTTKTINFVYGNNGIPSGNGQDNTQAATRTYITGSEIQEPDGITIPDGWYFEGYYSDYACTEPWDGFGDPLNEDTTVYIKLSQEQMMTLSIQKEIAFAEGSASINVSDKRYSFIISTTDGAVAGESYTTSAGVGIIFSKTQNDDGYYTATVTLTASTQNGVDGTVLIYGLPANSGSSQISYTVTEDTNNVDIDGYTFRGVTYSGGNGEGNNTVTGSGESSTASSTVLATNTYEKVQAVDITVTKVDAADTNKVLLGAEFYLARTENGEVTSYYSYNESSGVVTWVDIAYATKFTSDTYGTFIINSLEDGNYALVETKAPDGYVLSGSPFEFSVTKGEVRYESVKEGTDITVTNTTGTTLPNTGGIGTNLVTIGGLLLMATAVVSGYGLRRRRGKGAR